MPELPEAETIARGLSRVLPGRHVRAVRVLRPDVVTCGADHLDDALRGLQIIGVGRRGKNVVIELTKDSRVVVNLGMTGRLLTSPDRSPPPASRHAAVLLGFDDETSLTYDDARRFGRMSFLPLGPWRAWTASLGPEPLSPSFNRARIRRILATSRSPVRSLLLDQRKIAGVGNIYAVEALWKAKVHPARPANTLNGAEADALHRALRQVLNRAIEARGTTLRDYRTAEGQSGGFGPELLAYGREGSECRRCRDSIIRMRLSGRSAFYCPTCQGPPADPEKAVA